MFSVVSARLMSRTDASRNYLRIRADLAGSRGPGTSCMGAPNLLIDCVLCPWSRCLSCTIPYDHSGSV